MNLYIHIETKQKNPLNKLLFKWTCTICDKVNNYMKRWGNNKQSITSHYNYKRVIESKCNGFIWYGMVKLNKLQCVIIKKIILNKIIYYFQFLF